MIFNIFLTVFLFAQWIWFTATAGVLHQEYKNLNSQILSLAKCMESMNDINAVQLKLFKDIVDEVIGQLNAALADDASTTSESGAKRPKKNKKQNTEVNKEA